MAQPCQDKWPPWCADTKQEWRTPTPSPSGASCLWQQASEAKGTGATAVTGQTNTPTANTLHVFLDGVETTDIQLNIKWLNDSAILLVAYYKWRFIIPKCSFIDNSHLLRTTSRELDKYVVLWTHGEIFLNIKTDDSMDEFQWHCSEKKETARKRWLILLVQMLGCAAGAHSKSSCVWLSLLPTPPLHCISSLCVQCLSRLFLVIDKFLFAM